MVGVSRRLWLAGLTALGANSAHAQCVADSTVRWTAATLVVFASIPEDTSEAAVVRTVRGTILQEYVNAFERPPDLAVLQGKAEDIVRRLGGVYEPGMPSLGEVRFTQRADGRTVEGRISNSTTDPRLDAALLAAIVRLDALRLQFHDAGGHDTLQLRVSLSLNPSAGLYPMPLLLLRPLATIDHPAHIVPTNIYPKWPKKMEDARINDDVVVQLLVDEHGRFVKDSVRVVEGKHKEYIDAVIAVLPQYRWTPARSGGCAVKQWVQMPFMFHFRG
jgi:hypothetical protein